MIKNVRVITPRLRGTAALQLLSWPGLVCVACASLSLLLYYLLAEMSLRFVDLPAGGGEGAQGFLLNYRDWSAPINICVLLVKARIHVTKADKKGKFCKMNLGLDASSGFFQHSSAIPVYPIPEILHNKDNWDKGSKWCFQLYHGKINKA